MTDIQWVYGTRAVDVLVTVMVFSPTQPQPVLAARRMWLFPALPRVGELISLPGERWKAVQSVDWFPEGDRVTPRLTLDSIDLMVAPARPELIREAAEGLKRELEAAGWAVAGP